MADQHEEEVLVNDFTTRVQREKQLAAGVVLKISVTVG
jgi:hypothetical protein